MVEAAGVEPASGNIQYRRLHAYPEQRVFSGTNSVQARICADSLWDFAAMSTGINRLLSCIVDALTESAGRKLQDGSRLKRLQRSYNRLRLCLCPPFYEVAEPGMQPAPLYPRRIRFAPKEQFMFIQ